MADVAALRAPHEARLPDREGREVVVVPEALGLLQAEVVDLHVHAGRTECHAGQDLRLAAREERRAVHARCDVDLGLDRPDLVLRAAIGPLLVDRDPAADDVLLELCERGLDHGETLAIRQLILGGRRVLLKHLGLDGVDRLLTLELGLHLRGLIEPVAVGRLDRGVGLLIHLRRLDHDLLLAGLLAELLHGAAELLDLRVRDVERVQDLGLGDAIGAGLDHQDRLLGARHDQVEVELVEGLLLWVDDEIAVQLADPDGADVLFHRDLGDG
jgi:hypothetical protein